LTVLEGEGRVSILYGTYALPMPPYRSVYLSRPDLEGRYPAVVLAHGAPGLTSSVKAACRRLARFGYVAVAPDLYRGAAPDADAMPTARARADLEDAVEALGEYWTEWAADRLAVLGLGAGGPQAARLAASHGAATILIGGAEAVDVETLAGGGGPLLVLISADDAETVRDLHDSLGRGQWIRYGDVASGFHDEGSADYQEASAEDAYRRVIEFLDGHLATVVAV
jgi:carboxymethylenebutenolidase